MPKRIPRAFMRVLGSRQMDLILRFVSLIVIASVVCIAIDQNRQETCLKRYAEQQAVALKARFEAAEIDRQAEDRLYHDIAMNPRDSIAALREFNAARDVADAQREANPPPEPPSTICG